MFLLRTLLSLFVLVLLVAPASAQQPVSAEVGIEIINFGIYEIRLKEGLSEEQMQSDPIEDITDVVLLAQTSTVPLEIGTQFGCHYAITGIGEGESKTLTFELHHPIMVTDQGDIVEKSTFEQTVFGGTTFHDIFAFEQDWELVEGEYIFKIFFGGKLISAVRFEAY